MKYGGGQQGDKTVLALFVLAVIIALPLGILITRSGKNIPKSQQVGETAHQLRPELPKNGLMEDFQRLKRQIKEKNTDIIMIEKSLTDFMSLYGENSNEVTELRELIKERKTLENQAAKDKEMIITKADELKALIQNPENSLAYLESALSEFATKYGNYRKETRDLRALLKDRKKAVEEAALQEKIIAEEVKKLITRINAGNEDLNTLQFAVSEFVKKYGRDRKEIPGLRRLLEEQKVAADLEATRERMIAEDAKRLAVRINNEDENLELIEFALNEFVIRYGENRKEVKELKQLIDKRKDAERVKARIQESKKIMERLADPNYAIPELEQSIKEYSRKYGERHADVMEFTRLLSERIREQNSLEKAVTDSATLLRSQMGDFNYSVEKLEQGLQDFITKHGGARKEIDELKDLLELRKKTGLEAMISNETEALKKRITDETNSIHSLELDLDQFMATYGKDRPESSELKRLLNNRRNETEIAKVLSTLDRAIVEADLKVIRSLVGDQEFASKLVELTEWPGLKFDQQIQFFHRHGNEAVVKVEIDHAVEHMPDRTLHYLYHIVRNNDNWKIKKSSKWEY